MIIARFQDKRDNAPTSEECSWEQLEALLRTPRTTPCTDATCARKECTHKNGPGWSPVRYVPGTTRGAKNVIEAYALVLDVDDVTTEDLSRYTATIEAKGLRAIVHASHSDTPSARRVRIVLELAEPVSAARWPAFWRAAVTDLGIPADEAAKDISRLYYLPSRPADAVYAFATATGHPYSVTIPDGLPVASVSPPPASTAVVSPAAHVAAIGALAAAWPA